MAILARFLQTHALVSLADVLGRYPFEASWAERQLRAWAERGRAVPVGPAGDGDTMQWSAPENLEQVQRGSLGLLRREVTTCSPPQLADFLLRWQGAHPETQKGTAEGLAETLDRLQGLPLPRPCGNRRCCRCVPGYQPRWLDEWVAGGAGLWLVQGDLSASATLVFLDRQQLAELPPPRAGRYTTVGRDPANTRRPAPAWGVFVPDLAAATGLLPSGIRASLGMLMARSLVTNDHFDVVRREPVASPAAANALASGSRPNGRGRPRPRPEGRWSAIPWGGIASPELHAVLMAWRLLRRCGVAAANWPCSIRGCRPGASFTRY